MSRVEDDSRPMSAGAEAGGGIEAGFPSKGPVTLSNSMLKHVIALSKDVEDPATFIRDAQNTPDSEGTVFLEKLKGRSVLETLEAYLSSPYSDALAPIMGNELDYPLSNYYISSSHNTYLTGNQLYSDSSAVGYKDVLLRGCRCVEIDVWDGKPPDEDEDAKPVNEENRGLRERMGLKRENSKRGKSSLEHGIRERMGLKNRKTSKTGTSEPAASAPESDKLALPTPWRSSDIKRPEPRVLHGYTLTKEITFRAVCETIRDNAFVNSHLPVIVSLEVHAGEEQQEMMVSIMEEVWKDLLVHTNATSDGTDPEYSSTLPPPEQLHDKILIKVKHVAAEKPRLDENTAIPNQPPTKEPSSNSSSEDETPSGADKPKKKKSKILDTLSRLGVYTRAYHFKNFDQPEAKVPTHVFSVGEGAFDNLVTTSSAALFGHNKKFLMRAYPKGSRISSSNLDPCSFWRQGVQMVALNWQKCDKGTMLNEAMFAGTAGWVLKPQTFRSKPSSPSSTFQTQTPGSTPRKSSLSKHLSPVSSVTRRFLDLSIEVFAAQNLPLPPSEDTARGFKPYLKCTLHIAPPFDPNDIRPQRSRSRSFSQKGGELLRRRSSSRSPHPQPANASETPYQQNRKEARKAPKEKAQTKAYRGTDPDYGGEKLEFKAIPIGEEALSFVRFKVVDDIDFRKDELAAWACIRLDRLREGLRVLKLYDAGGKLCDGMVLIRVKKDVYESQVFTGGEGLPMR